MGGITEFFGQLFAPVGGIFHVVFYLPIYNVLILLYEGVHFVFPSDAFPAFAVSIFLLTVVIRLCLYPLTRKQLQSSRAMQALAPQVQELQRRYKNNPQEQMAATQALYREHGVSMYGGCLPLLIQMPFLYGLYYSLYTALLPSNVHGKTETVAHHLTRVNDDIYPFLPHLSHLPNTHFLWTNLATADHTYILPILAAVFTFIQLRMAQPVKKPTPAGQRPDTNTQVMGNMMYVMPIFTFIMAMNFPSGLAFYWAISTAFSGVQQYFLTGFGSLFVGIPGLEHLVPEPQSPPTLPGRPSASSAIVDSTSPSARPSGLGGLLEMLRQAAATRAAERAPENESATGAKNVARPAAKQDVKQVSNGTAKGASKPGTSANGAANGTTNGTTAQPAQPPSGGASGGRRVRPSHTAPMLVKRTQPASGEPESDRIAVGSAPGAPAAPPIPRTEASQPAARPNGNGNGNTSAAQRRPGSSSSRNRPSGTGGSSARRRSGSKSKGGK